MVIIGCDYHPSFQEIASVDTQTGECGERRLTHREEAEQFYSSLLEVLRARWIPCRRAPPPVRVVDRGRGGDSHETGREAEDRSPGCAVVAATDDGRPLPANLDARCGESQSAATAVASAGADAPAGDEPVAWGSAQRRSATQEGVVASRRPQGTGVDRPGSVGHASTARLTRLTDAEDPATDACAGRGSGEASSDAAVDDASRSRSADRPGVRVGGWNSRTLSLRETDRQQLGSAYWALPSSRTGSSRKVRASAAFDCARAALFTAREASRYRRRRTGVLAAFRTEEAAKLALLPDFSFTLEGGSQSDLLLSVLGLNPWLIHSVLGMFVPIYQGRALRAQIKIATAHHEQSMAYFGAVALRAFDEVEVALTNERLMAELLPHTENA